MIDRTIAWSIRNRAAVLLLCAVAALLAVAVAFRTPIDAVPDLSEKQVLLTTAWPGHAPQEVEDQVTRPLSLELRGLADVEAVRGASHFGVSMLHVVLDESADTAAARTRIAERLATAGGSLPAGVVPRLGPEATATGHIYWYVLEGPGTSPGELRALQDWYVRPELAAVAGVAEVASVGSPPREWQVDVDPLRLQRHDVSIGEVAHALRDANSVVGGGVIDKGHAQYLVRAASWAQDADAIRGAVVAHRHGTALTVGDVATVGLGPAPATSVLEYGGAVGVGGVAVGGVVVMRTGENPLRVTRAVERRVAELSRGLPDGVRIVPFYDRTRLVTSVIATMGGVLVEEAVIASVVILLVLMHLGASLVVCVALPLATLGSFALMHVFHVPCNLMSLAGIAVSVGVLVDQAVVLTDSAAHGLRERFGDAPVTGDTREALVGPCTLVGRPILFGIVIMLLSFLPVFALEGIEGRMFRPLAFTKSFALVTVGVLTLTVLPALLTLVMKGRIRREEDSWIVRSTASVYRPVLEWALGRPRLVVGVFLLGLAVAGALSTRLGSEFIPPLDEGANLDMPVTVPRVSVGQVTGDLLVRDRVLRSFPEVASVGGKAGRADTALRGLTRLQTQRTPLYTRTSPTELQSFTGS